MKRKRIPPLESVESVEGRAAAAALMLLGDAERRESERAREERLNLYDVNRVLARVNRERAGM